MDKRKENPGRPPMDPADRKRHMTISVTAATQDLLKDLAAQRSCTVSDLIEALALTEKEALEKAQRRAERRAAKQAAEAAAVAGQLEFEG